MVVSGCWDATCPHKDTKDMDGISLGTGHTSSRPLCNSNGHWVTAPHCDRIQHAFHPQCPPKYVTYRNLCIFVSEPSYAHSGCPRPFALNITHPENLQIALSLGIYQFWLPVTRSMNFSHLEWTKSFVEFYHKQLAEISEPQDANHNCVIVNRINTQNYNYEPRLIDCNSQYKHVCIYRLDSLYVVSKSGVHCSVSGHSNFCVFYMHRNDDMCTTKCKLAEPLTIADNYAIKASIGNRRCLFGLENSIIGNLVQWRHAGPSTYTDWTLFTERSKPLGAVSPAGWTLHNSAQSLLCCACELDLGLSRTSVTLRPFMNSTYRGLFLYVHMPFNVIQLVCKDTSFAVVDLQLTMNLKRHAVYTVIPSSSHRNYIWCEAIVFVTGQIISTHKVLWGRRGTTPYVYASAIEIENFCATQICDPHLTNIYKYLENRLRKIFKSELVSTVRVINILDKIKKNGDVTILFHIYPALTKQNETEDLNTFNTSIRDRLHDTVLELNGAEYRIWVKWVRSTHACLPVRDQGNGLEWPRTALGVTALPHPLCLCEDGSPLYRKCTGNFLTGAYWSTPKGTCDARQTLPKSTRVLGQIYVDASVLQPSKIMQRMMDACMESDKLQPADFHYIAQITETIAHSKLLVNNCSIVLHYFPVLLSKLMGAGNNVLETANLLLNATNRVLESTYVILRRCEMRIPVNGTSLFHYVATNNVTIVLQVDYTIQQIELDISFEKLLDEAKFAFAIQVLGGNGFHVSITVFHNDSLFVEQTADAKYEVKSPVVSVSMEGYTGYLQKPALIAFRTAPEKMDATWYCGYWDFGGGIDNYDTAYASTWVADELAVRHSVDPTLLICEYTYLAHFALLMENNNINRKKKSGVKERASLDYDMTLVAVTGACSVVSMISIAFVLVTAFLLRTWRNKCGNRILLNMCASSVLQTVALYAGSGALLQYAVLASFAWNLSAALLPYARCVLGRQAPSWPVARCALGAWIGPGAPVALTLTIGAYEQAAPWPAAWVPRGALLYSIAVVPAMLAALGTTVLLGILVRAPEYEAFRQQVLVHLVLVTWLTASWVGGLTVGAWSPVTEAYALNTGIALHGGALFAYATASDAEAYAFWTRSRGARALTTLTMSPPPPDDQASDGSVHEYDEIRTYPHANMMVVNRF